jgi:RNA 2',3'-cyclic 3'-phosphodiesterase
MRLFFASWPPAAVAEALAAWAGEARRDCGGRPTPPERIHLTLAFLGDADPRAAQALAAGVRLPRCAFRVEQARYWMRNRIIWAGPGKTPAALVQLAAALGEARRFAAHVTLIRKARSPRRLPPLPALDWPVEEFRLVNSAPGREGPDYEVLGRYALE